MTPTNKRFVRHWIDQAKLAINYLMNTVEQLGALKMVSLILVGPHFVV